MPFSDEFEDIYELGIRAACAAAGAYCERVDEQIFEERILDRIYNQIAKADVIVADMTGRNANVFYEVGYAHALGKPTVLLTKAADDIPFDLKHFPHIVYGERVTALRQKLAKRVRWYVEIRRYVLENDLLEAIIGLPTDMFYNTGISTYVWIVSNRKPNARKGKVQLIDASGFWQKMRKSLGSKRKELSPAHIEDITRMFGEFEEVTAEAQRAIDLLQERRTALISAAVTGQIDVRQIATGEVAA